MLMRQTCFKRVFSEMYALRCTTMGRYTGAGEGNCTRAHHFICENAVDTVVVQMDQPIQTLDLVLTHCAVLDDRGLHCEPVAPGCAIFIFIS